MNAGERPILFSTEMVKAILEGKKTQTRRVIKPQPIADDDFPAQATDKNFWLKEHIGKWIWPIEDGEHFKFSPYGKPGDLLYVRETWKPLSPHFEDPVTRAVKYKADNKIIYYPSLGDDEGCLLSAESDKKPWKPSIHMPKAASRIWLKVNDVRVERVQDISEKDAIAEGCDNSESEAAKNIGWYEKPRSAFKRLWDSINAKRENGKFAWDANPWVWVVDFEVISTNGKKGA